MITANPHQVMKPEFIHIAAVSGIFLLMLCNSNVAAQNTNTDSATKTIAPGPQYKRSGMHNFLWGSHYRKEWATPVRINKFYLDTASGGLTPYESGGSRQTKSLRLRDPNNREYVLRSIDKTFGGALPENLRGTFIEHIIDDQVSIAHPFAAVMVAPMAEAAGIYHTWPKNVYLPEQKALDTFNKNFSNTLYLFEQRPDENWETAPNFGRSKKIISTDKLFEKIHEDNDQFVDQEEYVRARLFDMFVGDWGRHEDQWRWASFKMDDATIYKPIPRDRDQTFTKFDGALLKVIKSVAGLGHQQTFDANIKNVRTYNFAARNIDRVLTNKMTLKEWTNIAKELQALLTDSIINYSIHQMPPELFHISGDEIISKLRSRRDHLVEYAEDYYKFLAKEVDITGTDKNEYFEITGDKSGSIQVTIYDLKKDGEKKNKIYERTFLQKETGEVRVYGWNGKDVYDVNIPEKSNIALRIIGGQDHDEYHIKSNGNVNVYDSTDEKVNVTGKAKVELSNDTAIHAYQYDGFKYNKQGISPTLYYSKQQHIIYVGLAFVSTKYKWRREPFASSHQVYVHYSPTQNALRTGFDGVVNQFIGSWSLMMNASYDWVKVINFYGVGNDTRKLSNDRDFYRLRMENGYVSAGIGHTIGPQGNITIAPFFQTVKLISDPDRFVLKDFLNGSVTENFFETKKFMGLGASLKLQNIDDMVVPTKGTRFTASAAYTKNINQPNDFFNFGGDLHFYFPLSNHFVLSIKNGVATTTGDAEFYQLNAIGGRKLRGYRRERFWGNTAYYNNNELQYLINVRSVVFNGKAGLLAFADQGRVWLKNEKSNTWHYGYGAGVLVAPFNKIYIALMYGVSPENTRIFHLDLRRTLK
jgi:hypothetical protein